MTVRIYLTGRVAVEVSGEVLIGENQLRGRQGRLAFAYLVSERSRPVAREELAGLLWPGAMPAAWEAGLSALLSHLRSLLGHPAFGRCGVALTRGHAQYQLRLPVNAWIDVETSAASVDEAEGALRAGDPGRAYGPAAVAASITRRPFLAGDDGEWAAAQRQRLQRQRLRALECIGRVWLATGAPSLAVEAAAEAIALDPFRESSYGLLMRAHAGTGNRPEAVKVYQRLRGFLAEELGTDPSTETEGLYLEMLG